MPSVIYKRLFWTLLPIIVVGFILYYFREVFTFVILGWVLSLIGSPINQYLRKYVGKALASASTIVIFAGLLVMLIWVFVPPLAQQTRNIAMLNYDNIVNSLQEPISDIEAWLFRKGVWTAPQVEYKIPLIEDTLSKTSFITFQRLDSILYSDDDSMRQTVNLVVYIQPPSPEKTVLTPKVSTPGLIDKIRDNLLTIINPGRITGVVNLVIGAVSGVLIAIISSFFIAFFFMKEDSLFSGAIRAISPSGQEEKWLDAISTSENMLKRYFIGIVIQIFCVGTFVGLTLSLLGFKNAVVIGFFAALMNVVPYIGPILGALFGLLITITANLDLSFYDVLLPKLGILLMVFGAMQMLDNFILQPNIFSKSVKAHPLEIFLVVLAGANLGGVLGMILAIPAYTILRVLLKVFFSEFKVVQRLTDQL